MKRTAWLLAAATLSACSTLPQATSTDLYQCDWGSGQIDLCRYSSNDARVQALMSEMSLDEKIGQMTQSVWHRRSVSPEIIRDRRIGSIIHTQGPTPGPTALDWIDTFDKFQRQAMQTRLGIPLLIGVDAVHGQNTFEGAVIFPHNIGMAATRNLDLIEQAARITAIEVAGTGFNWTFSPCIAMPQHEHWGRVYEGFSEDMDLTTAAVIASIRGHQGDDLSDDSTVAATAKHYIADGGTDGGIEGGNATVSEALLREYYLPPYQAAVQHGIASIMVGFNSVNQINMHQHKYLVTDVLKNELGFDGVVMTDWNGGIRFGEPHTVINAGADLAMQPGNHYQFMAELKASVEQGVVAQSRIDDAVRRILKLKFALGLFRNPFGKRQLSEQVGADAHRALARQAVRESLVLLKSANQALPLKADDRLAVVGVHGHNTGLQSGGWSINWQGTRENYRGATSIYDGVKTVNPDTEFAPEGCYPDMPAEKVVVVVGEDPYAEMKGDSDQLELRDSHKDLIRQCKALDKQVIVVLISGRVLLIKDDLTHSDAFVAAWLPGSEGAGVADFLFGTDGFTPTGKSPYAWPAKFEHLPLDQHAPHALFPYGHGLQDY